jgi:thymidylate kinase
VKILSFSGIDGAGKSTQICALENWLRQAGLSVTLFTFWDDVVAFPRFREYVGRKVFKGDQGIGSPEKPLHRRDKNIVSSPVIAMRFCLYFVDAISVCRKVRQVKKSDADVVIFDRYIYDELANLPLQRWLARAFVRFVSNLVPKPDIAYVIDADPVAAVTRKPEYPLEFLHRNREAYLEVARLTGDITVIEPLTIGDAESRIREVFLKQPSGSDAAFSGLPAVP